MWHYRVVTWMEGEKEEAIRMFGITEVYYMDRENPDNPNSWIDPKSNPYHAWENMKDLKGTHRLISKALKLPILDLDSVKQSGDVLKEYIPD